MIPSRRMVLIAVAPVVLALAAIMDETLLWPMLAIDGGLILISLIDAVWGWKPLVDVEREMPEVFSVGRPNVVLLEVTSRSRRSLAVQINDDLFSHAESPELPAQVLIAPRGHAQVRYRVRPGRRGAYELGDHHVRYLTPL